MGGEALSQGKGMTSKEELLAAFDAVWSHPWESVESILKDVSEEEAWYQHPIYSKEERKAGHPPSGSILWHIVHLGHCYRWYKAMILLRPDKPTEPPPPPNPKVPLVCVVLGEAPFCPVEPLLPIFHPRPPRLARGPVSCRPPG